MPEQPTDDERTSAVGASDVAARGQRRAAVVAALGAAVLWGTTGTAQELGVAEATPFTVAATRNLVGGLGLVTLVLLLGRRDRLRAVVTTASWAALAGSLTMSVFALGYLTAVREVGVGLGTLVTIGGAPIWAGLLGALAGRRPPGRWWVATATTIAGAVVLLLPGADVGTGAGSTVLGVSAGGVAGAAYASFATATRRLVAAGSDGTTTMAVTFAGSGVLLLPVLIAGDLTWVASSAGLATIMWLGLGTIVAGYVLFGRALRDLDAPTVTTFTLAEPLTATVLGVLLVGERPTVAGAVGGGLVAAGLVLVGGRPARSAQRPTSRRRLRGRR